MAGLGSFAISCRRRRLMPAWYERGVESAIAWDWRKARRCAKGLLLTQELELALSLLLERGDRTEISADETRNQQ